MGQAVSFRPAEIPESAWFTRYNFHPEERLEVVDRLLRGEGGASVLLLTGKSDSGRRYLIEAAAFRFEEPGNPVNLLTIDLEGFDEGGDIAAYLEDQAAKCREDTDETRQEISEAVAELVKRGAKLLTAPVAVALGFALQVREPVGTLLKALDRSIPTVSGPRYMAQEIFASALDSLKGRTLVHVVDAAQLPTVRSESSPWRWLAETVEQRAGSLLVVSCYRAEDIERVLPTLDDGVETLDVGPLAEAQIREVLDTRYQPHELPNSLATALVDYCRGSGATVLPGVVARGVVRLREHGGLRQSSEGTWWLDEEAAGKALAEGLWEPLSRYLYTLDEGRGRVVRTFLLDAALCGDLVPARLLIESMSFGDLEGYEVEDLIEEGLVDGLGVFEDLEYGLDTIPNQTYVYRFRDPLVRRVILDRAKAPQREDRAKAVSRFLEKALPSRTRDVARIYLHLADHLREQERERWRRTLGWWVGMDEAEELRAEVVRELKEGVIAPEVVWRLATESRDIWPAFRRLEVLDAYEEGQGIPLKRRGWFLFHRGRILLDLGRPIEGLAHAEEAAALLADQEGRHSGAHLSALSLWGKATSELGQLDLARKLYAEVLSVERSVPGAEHPSTLATRHNLAMVLEAQGDLSGARGEYEAVLEAARRVLGAEHPLTLTTRHHLAGVLATEGDLSGARGEYEVVLKAKRRVLGAEHPSTLTTRHNLAGVLEAEGDLSGARGEYEAVLKAKRRVLGAEHPSTLTTRHNLAGVLEAEGDLSGARGEYEAVLRMRDRVLGADHPSTLTTRHNLAGVLKAEGDLSGARGEYKAVLELRDRVLGADHPSTLETRHNLAGVLAAEGDLSGARGEYEAVLRMRDRVLGAEHPSTLATRHNLAGVLEAEGDLSGARGEYEAVLGMRDRVLGAEHPSTLETRHNLAGVLGAEGDLSGARGEYEAVLEAGRRVLGAEHPSTLTTRHNLAGVLGAEGDLSGARGEYEAVLGVWDRVLGAEHPSTLTTRHNLAGILRAEGDLSGARGEYEAVLRMRDRVLGAEHPSTLETRHNLAGVLAAEGDLSGARGEYEAVLRMRDRVLGADHPSTLATRSGLAGVLKDEGNLMEARREYKKLLGAWRQIQGEGGPWTLTIRYRLAEVWKEMGDLSAARTELEIVLEAAEGVWRSDARQPVETQLLLGEVLEGLGETEEARAAYQRVLELGRTSEFAVEKFVHRAEAGLERLDGP